MKFINLGILFMLLMHSYKLYGQWDSLAAGTKLYYNYCRKIIKDDDESNTPIYKIDSLYMISINKVISLKGRNRKLIVFSQCINEPLLGKRYTIVKDSTSLTFKNIESLIGMPVFTRDIVYSKHQISIIYKNVEAYYLITVPITFPLNGAKSIETIDRVLLQLNSSEGKYPTNYFELNSYFRFEGFVCPITKFFISKTKKGIEKYIPGTNDYLLDFYRYSYSTVGHRGFGKTFDYFTYFDKYGGNEICLSSKFGLIYSDTRIWDKQNGLDYYNSLHLIKVTIPRSRN